jgi:DNA (cytosine-5)-methyltransferase 1
MKPKTPRAWPVKNERPKHLDLFSGVGGFALAAEAAGWETVAFAECLPFPQTILGKYWPEVVLFEDVRHVAVDIFDLPPCECCGDRFCPICDTHFFECDCIGTDALHDRFGEIDLITAGWPCSDISKMGGKSGLAGARSGLWGEVARIVGEVLPRLVLVENSPNVLAGNDGRWFGTILGDLAALGYDAEWRVLGSDFFGVRQERERVFILAHNRGGLGIIENERAVMPTETGAAPFGKNQPIPHRVRVVDGVSDGVDIGKRLSAMSNAITPNIAYQILKMVHPGKIK